MKSILDLLDTIMQTPSVGMDIKERAGFLRSRLEQRPLLHYGPAKVGKGGDPFDLLFGAGN